MFHMTLNFSLNIHSTKITKFLQFFQFIRSLRFFYNKLTTINIYFFWAFYSKAHQKYLLLAHMSHLINDRLLINN